jgi:hypothetical protein
LERRLKRQRPERFGDFAILFGVHVHAANMNKTRKDSTSNAFQLVLDRDLVLLCPLPRSGLLAPLRRPNLRYAAKADKDKNRGNTDRVAPENQEYLNRDRRQAVAVVVIFSYPPEIMAVSDRIPVVKRGRVVEEMMASDASEEKIMFAAVH